MVKANQVMALPKIETTWPSHMITKAGVPVGRVLGVIGYSSSVVCSPKRIPSPVMTRHASLYVPSHRRPW
jgi:hypothetical protein